MYETLFHPAIWMPALSVVIGVIAFIVGNNRVHKPTRSAGLGLIGLGVLWFAVAYFVHTPVEQAVDRTKGIVAAVRTADWAKLNTLLDDQTFVQNVRGKQPISDLTQLAAEHYGLKDITILNLDAATVPPEQNIRVTINTFIEGSYPTNGRFSFTYERRSDGLLLSRIEPLEIGGHNIDDIHRMVR